MLAVHRREEGEGLLKPREHGMVGQHRIADKAGGETKMPLNVLDVVVEVLPDDDGVGMLEDFGQGKEDGRLFLLGPIAQRPLDAHEGEADRGGFGPGDTEAGDMPSAGFDVHGELSRRDFEPAVELVEDGEGSGIIRADYEFIIRANYSAGFGLPQRPLHIMNSLRPPLRFRHAEARGKGRNDLRTVGKGKVKVTFEYGPAPRGNAPLAGKCPHGRVAEGDDYVRLAELDFPGEDFEPLGDDR